MFGSTAWSGSQQRIERPAAPQGRLRPIRAAFRKARDLQDLERAGESEWTPWLAIVGLVLGFAVIEALIMGLVEAAAYFFG